VRLKQLLLMVGLLILFTACSQADNDSAIDVTDEVTFIAKVNEVNTGSLMVTPNEKEAEQKSADLISVPTSSAKLQDENGNEVDASVFKEGMEVEIVYDGIIAESYPAKILKCYEIRLVK